MLPAWWPLLRRADGNGEILLAGADYQRAVCGWWAVPAEYVGLNLIISFTLEREEILVCFADLRRLASLIPDFVADKLGADDKPTLRAALEDDFGMVGLDTENLLVEFGETYRVDLTQFDFTGCISPEPTGNPLIVLLIPPFVALFVLAWLANAVAALCYAPFSLSKARLMLKAGIGDPVTIARELLFPARRPRPAAQILTVGDLVASAVTGYFVKREKVRFVLAK